MPTNQQRREAERRRLQRQLEERRARELARRRFTLITSVVSTVAVIAIVVVIIVVATSGGGSKKKTPTASKPSTSTSPSATAPASPAAALKPPAACAAPGKGTTSSYEGVTVSGATDVKHAPKVSSKATGTPDALQCQDLVVGKGKAAAPTSSVTVQYTGALYKDGKVFDSSWTKPGAKPVTFSLTGVVPGFTQGIGGTGKVAPMRVGGRRVMILPPSLGYGAQAQATIPANSTLVFIVDLVKVS